jgi:integrase/recombinase XerD
MDWYGESLDLRPAKPKTLPEYVEPSNIERIIEVIGRKKTHKRTVRRDVLLVRFGSLAGLRRGELANLTVEDVLLKQKVVVVRKGKGGKDRAIPLAEALASEVSEFVMGMKPKDSLFGLAARSITDKLAVWSRKAGVKLHPHSLRHSFAEQLLERGTPLTVVQALLGHQNLSTTAVYLGLRPESLREAVNRLGETQDEKVEGLAAPPGDAGSDMAETESLARHIEKLSGIYDRLARVEEKKAYDEDPTKGIQPIVFSKDDPESTS